MSLVKHVASYVTPKEWALILFANIFPFLLYFFFDWSVGDYLLYFWGESVVIGIFYLIKAVVYVKKSKVPNYIFGIFFYGMVHLMLLILFIQFGLNDGQAFEWDYMKGVLYDFFIVNWYSSLLPMFAFEIQRFNMVYLGKKEYMDRAKDPLSYFFGRAVLFIPLLMLFGVFSLILQNAAAVVILTIIVRLLYDIDKEILKPYENGPMNLGVYVVNFLLIMFLVMYINAFFNDPRPIDLIAGGFMLFFMLMMRKLVLR